MKETSMKIPEIPIINLLLLPALIAMLNLIPAGRATAQTLATLHSFTATSCDFCPNIDGATPVVGKIVSADANSITVQLMDGSSKIVNLMDSTKISKADTALKSDLTTGQMVAAFGTANSDGSINAQTVQLNPMNMKGGGFGARGGRGPQPTQ